MAKADDPASLAFVDTNVLIYAFDSSEIAKRPIADGLLRDLLTDQRLVLSAQVLNEVYWVSTRPHRKSPLDHAMAMRIVTNLASRATVIPLSSDLTLAALEAVSRHHLSFWDALIWGATKEAGCQQLYSEDFQNGQAIEGVAFSNPFI